MEISLIHIMIFHEKRTQKISREKAEWIIVASRDKKQTNLIGKAKLI